MFLIHFMGKQIALMSNLLKPDLYRILFNHTDFNTKLQGMLTYLILAKITKWLILTLIFLKIK